MASKFTMGFIAGSILCTGMMMTTFESISAVSINNVTSQNKAKKQNESDIYAGAAVAQNNNATTTDTVSAAPFLHSLLNGSNPADTNYTATFVPISSSTLIMYRDKWTAKDFSPPSPPGDGRATVIVCSNLIPPHPSIWMNQTIQSVAQYVVNLESNYELIVAVDGLRPRSTQTDALRLDQYVQALNNIS